MKNKLLIFFIIGIILIPILVIAAQDRSAKEILLSGGKKGDVLFPHRIHQVVLKDCTKCHNLFPQSLGSIEKLKISKKLKRKQVMKKCRNCHKAKREAGEKSGPIGCNACHLKNVDKTTSAIIHNRFRSSLPDLKSQKHQKSQLFHLLLSFQIEQI